MPNRSIPQPVALENKLVTLVGRDQVSAQPHVSIHGVPAPLQVSPIDARQLGAVLAFASREELGICVAGGATKLGWGNRPRSFDLLIRTQRLRGFADADADNLSLSVAAGTHVAEAQTKAREMGRVLPLDPGQPGLATVGGVTATGDQGARGAAYGGVRDIVLGLRAVLADGSSVKFGGRTMKNVSGYDVTRLLIGSFGVLGVITEVTFRLLPKPERQALISVQLGSLDAAQRIVAQILASHLQPLALEVTSASFAGLTGVASNGYALSAAFSGHPAAVTRSVTEVHDSADSSPATILEDDQAESVLDKLAEAGAAAARSGIPLAARASVPISHVWELARAAESQAMAADLALAFRVGAARGVIDLYVGGADASVDDLDRLTDYVAALRCSAAELGGQLVVMRGLESLASDFDAWGDPGESVRLMRRLKERFDVHDVLNPGRFVGGI